jgi:hypothetical protein
MTQPPNLQKLIITNKNYHPSKERYATDMRTLEQWANEGIVRKLIAGSNITLTPSSGVDAGTGIEIAASGGGGTGLSAGVVSMQAGPDSTLADIDAIWFGIGGEGFISGGDLTSYFPIFSRSSESVITSFGAGWFAPPGPTYSACILPVFTMPAFTGGPITMQCAINAANATFSQFAVYEMETTTITFTTGETYQTQNTDFDYGASHGGDLTLTAGSGLSQNGLVTSVASPYWGGVSGYFTCAAGTTFT